MRGKTIVMLVGDPPVPGPNDPTKLDERMFKGRAMTYYGRWTYEYEIDREFVGMKPRPQRSLLFLAPTAEEKGLLGAKHYAEHPLDPLDRTLADLNMDGLNMWGRTRDVSVLGFGSTTLEDLACSWPIDWAGSAAASS